MGLNKRERREFKEAKIAKHRTEKRSERNRFRRLVEEGLFDEIDRKTIKKSHQSGGSSSFSEND